MKKTIYYYETPLSYGEFKASSDQQALSRMPKNAVVLYKETDNNTFKIIFERKKEP
jgi:hypothetical protein